MTRATRHGGGNRVVRFQENNMRDREDVSERNMRVLGRARRSARRSNHFLGGGITAVNKSSSSFLVKEKLGFPRFKKIH